MATATNITINDGQATPVARTFTFERKEGDVLTFVDRSTGVAAKFARLTLRQVPAATAGSKVKVAFRVSIPVWGVLPSGASGVIRTLRVGPDGFDIPDDSTAAERADLFAFYANGLNHALVKNIVTNLDYVN